LARASSKKLGAYKMNISDADKWAQWGRKVWGLILYFRDRPIRQYIEAKRREQQLSANPNILDWKEDDFIHEYDRKPSSIHKTLLRLEVSGVIHEYRPKLWRSGPRPKLAA
jgi:hypothetical protein